jgi:hypothetical protein
VQAKTKDAGLRQTVFPDGPLYQIQLSERPKIW